MSFYKNLGAKVIDISLEQVVSTSYRDMNFKIGQIYVFNKPCFGPEETRPVTFRCVKDLHGNLCDHCVFSDKSSLHAFRCPRCIQEEGLEEDIAFEEILL